MRRRDAYERDPAAFAKAWKQEEDRLRRQIVAARERAAAVGVPDAALERAARLCIGLGTDGLRGELTLIRAARALAALEGDARGRRTRTCAGSRRRRCATGCAATRWTRRARTVRVERAVAELFGA